MGQYSKVETDGRMMMLTINRPEVYNALHPMANQELSDALDAFAADSELWVRWDNLVSPGQVDAMLPGQAAGGRRPPGLTSVRDSSAGGAQGRPRAGDPSS